MRGGNLWGSGLVQRTMTADRPAASRVQSPVIALGLAVISLVFVGMVAAFDQVQVTTEVPFDSVRTDESGRSLVVSFVGAPPDEGPCGRDYTTDVAEEAEGVLVTLRAVQGDRPGLAVNEACQAVGYLRTVVMNLAEPLGDRPVVDQTSGVVHLALVGEPLEERSLSRW